MEVPVEQRQAKSSHDKEEKSLRQQLAGYGQEDIVVGCSQPFSRCGVFDFRADGENRGEQDDDPENPRQEGVVEIDRVAYPRVAQRVHVYGDGLNLRQDVAFVFTPGQEGLLHGCGGRQSGGRLEAAIFQGSRYQVGVGGVVRQLGATVGHEVGFEVGRNDDKSEDLAFLHGFPCFGKAGVFCGYGEGTDGRELPGEVARRGRVVEVDYRGRQLLGQASGHEREEEHIAHQRCYDDGEQVDGARHKLVKLPDDNLP